jgi:hypothetical protein
MLKSCCKLLSILLVLALVGKLCLKATGGFTLDKIQSHLAPDAQWSTPPPTPDVQSQLSQKFFYLGKGAQSFAFVSEDGQLVIKFFRHDHLRTHPFAKAEKREKYLRRQRRHFASCKLAFDQLKQQTGLVYLHLNKTDYLKQTITLVDRLGIGHPVELDQMEFLLQKWAEPVYPRLQRWIEMGKIERVRTDLDQLSALISLRCKKNIADKDPDLKTNFGFTAEGPIQIDVGRFQEATTQANPDLIQSEQAKIMSPLLHWLSEQSYEH